MGGVLVGGVPAGGVLVGGVLVGGVLVGGVLVVGVDQWVLDCADVALLCAAFVIGSSHGPGLRGQVRVMRPNVVEVPIDSEMGFILENSMHVLEGELVSESCLFSGSECQSAETLACTLPQVGAQFGIALATADFDGDG